MAETSVRNGMSGFVSYRLPRPLLERLERAAADGGKSRSAIVREALEGHLGALEAEPLNLDAESEVSSAAGAVLVS